MSCVNYWNECEKCKFQTYDRNIKNKCEKCGSAKMNYIKECDENFAEQDDEMRSHLHDFDYKEY